MQLPSLETLADRWTRAHTVMVAAWVFVLVLAVMSQFRHQANPYPSVETYKLYAAENATFTYPTNWKLNGCIPDVPFIELPGSIKANYKGQRDYQLTIYGTGAFSCMTDRPERLDIYSEQIVASDHPCAIATSTRGERLPNGLYLQLQQQDEDVVAVYIKQNACFAPADTVVLGFAFTDPKAQPGDAQQFGPPRINEKTLVISPQYQDIRTLAASIRY